MKHVYAIVICTLLIWSSSSAQEPIYDYTSFIQQVSKFHPLAAQANLVVGFSEADLRLRRAVNDPYLQGGFGDKGYDGKDYYEKTEMKFAIPTSLGMEIFAGYESNIGPEVNPEIATSNTGLYKAGVSMPLGPGLLLNERQLAIRQGKVMVEMAEQERRVLVNDLLFRANLAYLNWSLAFAVLEVQENAITVANDQFQFIKEVFLQGDRPAIDTVEAFLQLQNRQFRLLDAQRNLNAARLILSTFLWDENGNPLELPEGYFPEDLTRQIERLEVVEDSFLIWQNKITEWHPELSIKRLGIRALQMERQNAIGDFVPEVQLSYAALTPGVSERDINAIGLNDRMLGLGIKYPLLLRKERSKLSLVNIKTEQKQYDLDLKVIELNNKLEQTIFEYGIAQNQSVLYDRMTQNYSVLLEAEKTKFSIGESSVFLLNARENKLFDAQEKLMETRSKAAASALKVIQTANQEGMYLKILN